MRRRLATLGFAMALEPVPNLKSFDLSVIDDDGGLNCDRYGTPGSPLRKTASSHTAGGSAHTSGNVVMAPSSPFMQRPLKRQRIDSPLPNKMLTEPTTSRDAMPPPQKPISRMRSVRKIFPTLRKKLTGGRINIAPETHHSSGGDVHMYEEGGWDDDIYNSASHTDHHGQGQPVARHDYRSETPYMSGALPVEQSQAIETGEPQFPSSVGTHNDLPDFRFRAASPRRVNERGNRHHPGQLPTEPSYIRLMDGLSHDNGIELRLRDPRVGPPSVYLPREDDIQVNPYCDDRRRYRDSNGLAIKTLGRTPHYQTPSVPFHSTGSHLESVQRIQTDSYDNRTIQGLKFDPTTPAPRNHQQTGHQIESVVSPYLNRRNRNFSLSSNFRIAEPQDSSNRSAAYQSQKSRVAEHEGCWQDSRGLNGLSFFQSPVISRSHPVEPNRTRQQSHRSTPSQRYRGRNLNSRGFITRPDAERSPFFSDSAYGSLRDMPTNSKHQAIHSTFAIPFPSFSRSSYARTNHNSSAIPSIGSGRPIMRTRPQWEGLQRIGVRSSRHDFSTITGNTRTSPTRKLLSRVGQRSVQR